MTSFSEIPSVDVLLQSQDASELIGRYGRKLTIAAIREVLDGIRDQLRQRETTIPIPQRLIQQAEQVLERWSSPTLLPVINATGVVLHTNLGRAPLSAAAIKAMQDVAQGYSNLEYSLKKGKRGSRYHHAEELLKLLTGAEAALVVNNNASALLLMLSVLAKRRRVLIARTQLIEIGGGFRIPEVMEQSGAKLVEIGATNRVHLEDYQKAIETEPIKVVMRVHRSNFRLEGFTSEPSLKEIADLAHAADLPLVDDLGSGTFLDTAQFGLAHETTVQESLEAGSDLVSFSGDKLLGGPQAGVIVGKAKLISKLKKSPMARAIRADKLALAALSATLLHYLKGEAETQIPIWQMIAMSQDDLKGRAQNWISSLNAGEVIEGESTVGGGSLPGEQLPTWLAAFEVPNPDKFLATLRRLTPAVIGRVHSNRVVFDPRTVLETQEDVLINSLRRTLGSNKV